jgi:hypothetical protein
MSWCCHRAGALERVVCNGHISGPPQATWVTPGKMSRSVTCPSPTHIGFVQACPWTATCLMIVSLRARKVRISRSDGRHHILHYTCDPRGSSLPGVSTQFQS